jgi:hypothetical protein
MPVQLLRFYTRTQTLRNFRVLKTLNWSYAITYWKALALKSVFFYRKQDSNDSRQDPNPQKRDWLEITQKQAQSLDILPYVQISGHLERCCLLLSANESYGRAEQDIEFLTGMKVSHSSQQRLVHRHKFPEVLVSETVEEISIDGGKVRLRTPLGERCIWNDYKAIRLHELATAAYFKENASLVDWANHQPLATPLFGLGDGHDGIWNVFESIGTPEQRYEILDWYHLKENLYNILGSLGRIEQVEALLWKGNVDAAIEAFNGCVSCEAVNFVAHLQKHRSRIPNYEYLQHEGGPLGRVRLNQPSNKLADGSSCRVHNGM